MTGPDHYREGEQVLADLEARWRRAAEPGTPDEEIANLTESWEAIAKIADLHFQAASVAAQAANIRRNSALYISEHNMAAWAEALR